MSKLGLYETDGGKTASSPLPTVCGSSGLTDLSPTSSHDPEFVKSSEPLTNSYHHISDNSPNNSLESRPPRPIDVLQNWKLILTIITPLALLWILFVFPDNPVAKCAYILLIMAIYWCTEALPLPATALIPIFLAPMIGLMSSKEIAVNYLTDLNFLFVGGLMFAVAIEKWNLHKRIALRVLLLVGTKPKMLLLGFISVTAFLSMWLSNTATTAMMIPIAHAVLVEMWKNSQEEVSGQYEMSNESVNKRADEPDNEASHGEDRTDHVAVKPEHMSPKFQNLGKAISLCVCYAANIGGTGTLTGTGPNIVLGSVIETNFKESTEVTFGSWMLFSVPLMILCLVVCWLVLVVIFLGPRSLLCCNKADDFDHAGGKQVLRREYRKLGPTSFPEAVLIVFFILLGLLWLWRDPKFTAGWGSLFQKGFVSDAATGIFICTFLYTFPSSLPGLASHKTGYKLGPPLLDWDTVQRKLPWGVIILLGGGFALADMCKKSGLSEWIGCQLAGLDSVPKAALVFICGAVMTLFTEFTSNTSSAGIFLPILAQLAVKLQIHPLYLLIPITICSSYAFAFPVATPPNAIVFAFGYLKVKDMVKAGMLMNLLCLVAVTLAINTWGSAYFNLQTVPEWAASMALQTTATIFNPLFFIHRISAS